jgi:hypothetical protein
MIVERRTYEVQFGHGQEMVDIIKTEMEAVGPHIVSRIYRDAIGPFNRVAHEMEFQDLAEREKFWEEWADKRLTPEFLEKWTEIAPGGGNEIWILED